MQIARAHRGKLWHERRDGGGSRLSWKSRDLMQTRILIVEDDPHIVFGLQEILRGEDFEVVSCTDGARALATYEKEKPSLIILDVLLPGKSGYDLCKELRERNCSAPILMLTAKGQEIDKVIGLELGADDYVTKPFGVRELIARVHALLRRQGRTAASPSAARFKIGGAEVDPKRFELRRGKVTEELTAKELKLLQHFFEHAGEVLSREHLLNEVWGYEYFGTTRTLDQVVAQLRKKLGDSGREPRYLTTVHGVGYRLVL
jgi:DNA-binding response OmpR family regulator